MLRPGLPRQREGEAGIGERLRSDEVLRETTKLLPAPPTSRPQVRGSLGFSGTNSNVASGSPVPRRRTFAPAIHGLRSLDAACAPPSMAALAVNAGSRSTGDPSLATRRGELWSGAAEWCSTAGANDEGVVGEFMSAPADRFARLPHRPRVECRASPSNCCRCAAYRCTRRRPSEQGKPRCRSRQPHLV